MPSDPNLTNRFNDLLAQAPHLVNNPGVAIPLALNPAAAEHVPAIAALDRGQQIAAALIAAPQAQELDMWSKMGAAEQSMAVAAGYKMQFARAQEEHKAGWGNFFSHVVDPRAWVSVTAGSVKDTISAAVDLLQTEAGAQKSNLSAVTPDFVGQGAGKVGDVLSPVADAFHATADPVAGATKDAFGWAVHRYHDITQATDRAYRAGELSADTTSPFASIAGLATSLTTGDFKRYWDAADRKNAPIDAGTEHKARAKYGDKIVDLVRLQQKDPQALLSQRASLIQEGATAGAAGDLATAKTKQDQAAQLDEYMSSPTFSAAFAEMDDGLLSPGRDLARSVGLTGTPQNIVSGVADGAYRVMTDPLLVGGEALGVYRAGKYGLALGDAASAGARVDEVFQTTRVQRFWDEAGVHFEQIRNPTELGAAGKAVGELDRNFKMISPALRESMVKAGVTDAATAQAYFHGETGYTFLLNGRAAFGRPLMPYRTALKSRINAATGGARDKAIDWIGQGPHLVRDDLLIGAADAAKIGSMTRLGPAGETITTGEGAEVTAALKVAQLGWRGRSATVGKRLSTKLPELSQSKHLDLMGPGADAQVSRIAAMFGPKYWARQVGVTFMHANEVGRRDIVKGLYATMFESMGVTKTAEGRLWSENFFKTMDQSTGAYTVTGVGEGLIGREAAIFKADFKPTLPVPNFAEAYAQAAKLGASKVVLDHINTPMADAFMNKIWRPSVLLRPALAFRNSIDEVLNQYLREGPLKVVAGRLGTRYLNTAQLAAHKAAQDAAYDAKVYEGGIKNALMHDLEANYGRGFSADALPEKITTMRQDAAALRTERQGAGPYAGLGSAEKRRGLREEQRGYRKARAGQLDAEATRWQERLNAVSGAEQRSLEARLRMEVSPDAFDTEMGRLFRAVAAPGRALGTKILKSAKEGTDLHRIGMTLAHPTRRGVYDWYRAHVYGKFSETALRSFSPHTIKALDELVDNQYARGLFNTHIMEMGEKGARMEVDNAAALHVKGKGFDPGRVRINGTWGKVTAQGDDGADAWHLWFDKAASDPVGRHMLLHLDDPEEAIAGAVRIVNADKDYLTQSSIVAGAGPEAFARSVYNEVRSHVSVARTRLVRDPETGGMVEVVSAGELIPGLAEKLRYGAKGSREVNKAAFSHQALRAIPNADRPEWVHGLPGMWMDVSSSATERLVQGGFKTIGDMTAYLSRQNQFASAYVEARQLNLPLENDLIARLGGDEVAKEAVKQKMVRDALDSAIVKATAYVDNPEIRSQAAVLLRNLAPFWRAQEEFMFRWAKAFKYNPEAMGRAMLGVHATTASGVIHKDENGQYYFVYPGGGVVHKMMANVGETFGLSLTRIPISTPMTGKVLMLTPGFNPDGTVHIFNSPMLAEPIRMLSRITDNPEFDAAQASFLGPGANRGFIESNMPALFRPLYQEYSMGDEKHTMNALAAIYSKYSPGETIVGAKGLTGDPVVVPTQDSSAQQKADFKDLLRRHVNGIKLLRSVFGPLVPAYPRVEPASPANPAGHAAGLDSVRQEYFDLVKKLVAGGMTDTDAFSAAYPYWFEEHPNEIPFIVGQSDVTGLAPISSSAAAGQFVTDHRAMLVAHPQAGVFFIPQGGDDFSMKTVNLLRDTGLRETKSLDDYIGDLQTGDTVSFYYKQREKMELAKADLKTKGDTAGATRLNESWGAYRDTYLKTNPLVQDYLNSGAQRDADRARAFEDMKVLLASPEAPDTPATPVFRALVDGWAGLQNALEPLKNDHTDFGVAQRKVLRDNYGKWAEARVKGNAAGQVFYDRLLRWVDN